MVRHFSRSEHRILTRLLFEGVTNATWDATYDIYVKTDTKEKAVTFNYKAAILQSTGEVRILYSSFPAHPDIDLDIRHGTTSP